MPSLSVVVPTYNRGGPLRTTLAALLESQTSEIGVVEVIVVDDGSATPAEQVLKGEKVPPGFALQVLRRQNGGPARARNSGFRAATGDVVLFMDDDIIAGRDLLRLHVLAHRERPGSVIFGHCSWLPPPRPGTVFRLLNSLAYEEGSTVQAFEHRSVVSSGQISVERSMFETPSGVYCDDLATPAAEEFELSIRLRRRGIPILLAPGLEALHDAPTTIAGVCRQQYQHGFGCGEAARRCPETLELEELAAVVTAHTPGPDDGPRRGFALTLKGLASSRPVRSLALLGARLAEGIAPQADILSPLYRHAIASHFSAGVREGLARYAGAAR